jgi:hypothetical protein
MSGQFEEWSRMNSVELVRTNGHTADGDRQIRAGMSLGLGILISLPLASKRP